MSPESRYTYLTQSFFVPVLLLAITLVVVLAWQVSVISKQKTNFEKGSEDQEQLVMQSREIQANLERLIIDLLELAQIDDDARAIVAKYNIQHTPAAPAGQ